MRYSLLNRFHVLEHHWYLKIGKIVTIEEL